MLLSVFILATNCKDIKLDIQNLEDRLDVLEGTPITLINGQIASINGQITAINMSISDLKVMGASLESYVKVLEMTAADLQNQIDEANAEIAKVESELGDEISSLEQNLLNKLNAAKEAIEAELAAINATLEELRSADSALDVKIEDLRTYVASQLASTTNWANATFSTLTHYAETQTEIAAIKASIEQAHSSIAALETRLNGKITDDINAAIIALRSELKADYVARIESAVKSVTTSFNTAISLVKEELTTAYKDAILIAISESEAGMKSWVNEQLAQSYYEIAALDGKLSVLSARMDDADEDIQKQINAQKSALETAKTELTNEYKAAISQAIQAGQGTIDSKISTALQNAMTEVSDRLSQIDSRIVSLEDELRRINEKLDKLDGLDKLDEFDKLTREFSITFDDYDVGVTPGSSASVSYTVIGATEKTTIKALGGGGWRVQVIPAGINKGKIKVTAPDPLVEEEIIVLAYDGEYRTIMSTVNFITGVITPSQTAYEVPAEAGVLDIEVTTNFNYSIRIPEDAQNWLTHVNTKSIRTDVVTIAVAANRGGLRNATILFEDEAGNEISRVGVTQSPFAVDLGASGTANSYIVSKEGWYRFDASVKGNSKEKLIAPASADVIWESFGTYTKPEVGDLIQTVILMGDYIYFQTPSVFKAGNAMIAVRDNNDNILWSWHIWLTDQPKGQKYYNNAGTMMDRNLGATSADPGDDCSYGLLYQWGRKDPFMSSLFILANIRAKSTLIWPSAVASDSSTGTIEYATANPTTFISYNSSNYDWYYTGSSSADNTRWTQSGSAKSIYDPCPVGWRVPDGGKNGVWPKALGSSSTLYDYPCDNFNKGMNFSARFGSVSPIWYTVSGSLNESGDLVHSGSEGLYWSASPGQALRITSTGYVYPYASRYRAEGLSVRCIKE